MRPRTFIAFIGFVILIAGTYCPLLRPFHLFNWNLFDLNKPYGMVMLLVFTVGIIGTVFNQIKIAQMAAWLSLILLIVLYLAVILKIHTSFSFIHFQSISVYLSKQIAFKWGWYLLSAGQLLTLAGVIGNNKKLTNFSDLSEQNKNR
jgi:hypothetical protein